MRVKSSEEVACPYCGQTNELVVEAGNSSQRFVTDCEVCCRPFEVVVEVEEGEILSVVALGE